MLCLQEAECEKSRMDTKFDADTKIADAARLYQMQKANFDIEVNARVCSLQKHINSAQNGLCNQ